MYRYIDIQNIILTLTSFKTGKKKTAMFLDDSPGRRRRRPQGRYPLAPNGPWCFCFSVQEYDASNILERLSIIVIHSNMVVILLINYHNTLFINYYKHYPCCHQLLLPSYYSYEWDNDDNDYGSIDIPFISYCII